MSRSPKPANRRRKASRTRKVKSIKLAIILISGGGELDRKTVTAQSQDDLDEAANLSIHEAIESWRLYAGDVIKIETVPA